MAIASYWVGAIPMYFRGPHTPIISAWGVGAFPLRLLFYAGLSTLFIVWLLLGRLTLDGATGTDFRSIRRIALAWAAPLLVAIPLASRDLWAYAAQSQLVLHHLDPYSLGPAALPGAFSVEVSHRWVDTPAPYGPLWLLIGKGLAYLAHGHVGVTVAALRGLAAVGLLLLAISIPTLAQRAGGSASVAMWLIVANPMTLVLCLGGGHNDLLMVGLMVSGLALVTSQRPDRLGLLAGVAVLAAAVAVKSPAAVGLAFAVPLWLSHTADGRRCRQAHHVAAATVCIAVWSIAVFSAITALSGLGLGWVKQVNSSAPVVTWMSIPTSASMLWHLVTGHAHRMLRFDSQMAHFRTAGTAISIVLLLGLWALAMRETSGSAPRRVPAWLGRQSIWQLGATALVVLVVTGPSVQPWYFLWALSLAALTPLPRRLIILISGLSLGVVAMIRPNGIGLQMNPSVVAFLVIPVVVAAAVLRNRAPLPSEPASLAARDDSG